MSKNDEHKEEEKKNGRIDSVAGIAGSVDKGEGDSTKENAFEGDSASEDGVAGKKHRDASEDGTRLASEKTQRLEAPAQKQFDEAETVPLPKVMSAHETSVMATVSGFNPRRARADASAFGNGSEAERERLSAAQSAVAHGDAWRSDAGAHDAHGAKKLRFRRWQIALIAVIAVVLLLATAYGIGSMHWSQRFYPNTSVGTVDLSGKTFEEAESVSYTAPDDAVLTVTDSAIGSKDELKASDIGVSYDYRGALSKLEESHSSALWFIDAFNGVQRHEDPNASYDEAALEAAAKAMSCMTAEREEPVDARLKYEDGTFSISPEKQGTAIDQEALLEAVKKSVSEGQRELEIADLGIYKKPTVSSDDAALASALDLGQRMLTAEVTFTDGASEKTITRNDIAGMLYIGEDGKTVEVDQDAVAEWMSVLGKEYDTAGKTRDFKTTGGSTVQVSGGDYGWITDEASMVKVAIDAIKTGKPSEHDIVWQQTAAQNGNDEWGGTYVEVSIAQQHLWCYKNGELALSCDVITGKPDGRHDTSTGVYTIKMKASPYVMVGDDENGDGKPDYRTPCDYFILWTNTGIAFHDATWQPSFGGSMYKQGYGSHGCVNMSYSTVQKLWDLVSEGDPVICY